MSAPNLCMKQSIEEWAGFYQVSFLEVKASSWLSGFQPKQVQFICCAQDKEHS